jgi:hypothetical protein
VKLAADASGARVSDLLAARTARADSACCACFTAAARSATWTWVATPSWDSCISASRRYAAAVVVGAAGVVVAARGEAYAPVARTAARPDVAATAVPPARAARPSRRRRDRPCGALRCNVAEARKPAGRDVRAGGVKLMSRVRSNRGTRPARAPAATRGRRPRGDCRSLVGSGARVPWAPDRSRGGPTPSSFVPRSATRRAGRFEIERTGPEACGRRAHPQGGARNLRNSRSTRGWTIESVNLLTLGSPDRDHPVSPAGVCRRDLGDDLYRVAARGRPPAVYA